MATLFIVEFASSVIFPTSGVAIVAAPPVATQTVVLGSTSVMCTPFNQATNIIRVQSDANCAIQFTPVGTTVATAIATASWPISAFAPEYIGLPSIAYSLGTAVAPGFALAACTT